MTLPQKMSGVVLTGHGGLEMLEWRDDLTVPTPGKGDVIVRVSAAGVNNTDINTRLAWYSKGDGDADDATWSGAPIAFPLIQGIDVCGQIVATGEGVDPKRIGEQVLIEPCLLEANGERLKTPWFLGSECNGGFADYTRVASRHAYRIVSDLTDAQLASFPCSYSTAENMLTRTNVGPDDTVLITGASGDVGLDRRLFDAKLYRRRCIRPCVVGRARNICGDRIRRCRLCCHSTGPRQRGHSDCRHKPVKSRDS